MFEDFVTVRGQALQRFGYALTGDWALAEDLLQTALARAYPRWSRIQDGNAEAYVRKIMVNTWSSWWRRRWRGEVPSDLMPDSAGPDRYGDVDNRQTLRRALAALSSRQRAVVVLHYHQDLSEAQVADLLGISVGTVKSQVAKALSALRAQDVLQPYQASAGHNPATGRGQ